MEPCLYYVAIIGGLWRLDAAQASAAKEAAEQLGEELAKASFGLVVYSSDENSLEPHVVAGYIRTTKASENGIRVRFSQSQRGQVRFKEEAAFREAFAISMFPGQDWETPFYQSLAAEDGVDAVLLLSGSTSTLIAGQIALARGLPVLAVDEFGGAAAKIWSQLAYGTADVKHGAWATSRPSDLVKLLHSRCGARRQAQQRMSVRLATAQQILEKRNIGLHASFAFAALLVAVYFGMVHTPPAYAYSLTLFAGLVTAGATGGLIRTLVTNTPDTDGNISLLLGSIAGFVVGIAYLIPQWIGAPGPLSPRVSEISANDKIQFASSILIAISAGVGFDSVFQRLKRQAQTSAISPPNARS